MTEAIFWLLNLCGLLILAILAIVLLTICMALVVAPFKVIYARRKNARRPIVTTNVIQSTKADQ